ncbi:unnamed protein product [Brassica rapa]|uniref:Uncharacterized protein n=1 Tax=Brassica campestris TaxID=3711 RepID=A0A3P5ZR84_BRACM|nr:unnamed protein product [Brassica rapa]CAG7881188.1 unnamed protein product [Brassica rapa]VDC80534.1 unnamed protein product [Brassica rapa]VDC80539.1 unnamed protein product [Brassica rapa]
METREMNCFMSICDYTVIPRSLGTNAELNYTIHNYLTYGSRYLNVKTFDLITKLRSDVPMNLPTR